MAGHYVTIEEMARQINCSACTIKRLIGRKELPEFTYGKDGKCKGWHVSALEQHARRREELADAVC